MAGLAFASWRLEAEVWVWSSMGEYRYVCGEVYPHSMSLMQIKLLAAHFPHSAANEFRSFV